MNFKSMTLKTAALAALSVASAASFAAPSQAASVGGTLDVSNVVGSSVKVLGTGFDKTSTITPTVTGLQFFKSTIKNKEYTGKDIQVTTATDNFTSYIGSFGTINTDLTFSGGISGAITKFMSIQPDLFFNLTQAVVTVGNYSLLTKQRPVSVDFTGTFSNALGNFLGSGLLTTQLNVSKGKDITSGYSITSTAVPTPALLPGLLGLGVAALRKRKSEESEVEAAETAKA